MPLIQSLAYRVETTLTDGTVERSPRFAYRTEAAAHATVQRLRDDVVATAVVLVDAQPADILARIAAQPGLDPAFGRALRLVAGVA